MRKTPYKYRVKQRIKQRNWLIEHKERQKQIHADYCKRNKEAPMTPDIERMKNPEFIIELIKKIQSLILEEINKR